MILTHDEYLLVTGFNQALVSLFLLLFVRAREQTHERDELTRVGWLLGVLNLIGGVTAFLSGVVAP